MSRRVIRKQGVEVVAYLWWEDQEIFEHTSGAGQPVIQNDIWAHPITLNQICARVVDGEKARRVVGLLDRSIATYPAGVKRLAESLNHKNEIQYYLRQSSVGNISESLQEREVDTTRVRQSKKDHVYAVNDEGSLLDHYRYTAFGEPEIYSPQTQNKLAGSAIANPVLWNSRRYDEQTDLYYYKYRHYKADIGRWLGRAPLEEAGGFNLYGFVGNEPIGRWDVLGLKVEFQRNEGSGKKRVDQFATYLSKGTLANVKEWLQSTYGNDDEVIIDAVMGTKMAHTFEDVRGVVQFHTVNNNYDKVFSLIVGHGAIKGIVPARSGQNRVITDKDVFRLHKISLDKDVYTHKLYFEGVHTIVYSCYLHPQVTRMGGGTPISPSKSNKLKPGEAAYGCEPAGFAVERRFKYIVDAAIERMKNQDSCPKPLKIAIILSEGRRL